MDVVLRGREKLACSGGSGMDPRDGTQRPLEDVEERRRKC